METGQNPRPSVCAVCRAAPSQLCGTAFDVWQCRSGDGKWRCHPKAHGGRGKQCWWVERSPWCFFPRSAQPWDLPCMASLGNRAKVSFRAVFWFGVSSCFHGREFPFLTKDEGKKKKRKKKKKKPALNFGQKNGMFPFLFWLLAAPNCSQWKKLSLWKCCWPPLRAPRPWHSPFLPLWPSSVGSQGGLG